jgi:hypothetical protein
VRQKQLEALIMQSPDIKGVYSTTHTHTVAKLQAKLEEQLMQDDWFDSFRMSEGQLL